MRIRFARPFLVHASIVAALFAAPHARAQSNAALAEKLFLEGQKMMAEGNPAACGKLADSERLDPALGTLINLAVCHEKQGKTATAWSEFMDASAQAQKAAQRDREGFARAHAAALEKRLQKMIVEVAVPAAGMEVSLDGVPLPGSVLGTEIPLDPGDHELAVIAPGKKPWRQAKLNLGPSAVVTRVAVTLEDAGSSASPDATVPPPNTGNAAGPEAESPGGRRTAGFVGGGVGLAGVAVGGVMLGLASSLSHRSDAEILSRQVAVGDNDHRAAISDQTIGLVAGGAGIVGLGIATVLILTSRGSSQPTVTPASAIRILPRLGQGNLGIELGTVF
jgi:hypothetical protein